jgi:hypothetical protein
MTFAPPLKKISVRARSGHAFDSIPSPKRNSTSFADSRSSVSAASASQ